MSVLSDPPTLPTSLWARFQNVFAGRSREWPTYLVAVGCYGGFAALTLYWEFLSVWIAIPLAGYLICWHGHLTHEVVHGHPTNSARLNHALIGFNLGGWVPYPLYRDTHIAHHETEHLSHPTLDPESQYHMPEDWAQRGPIAQAYFTAMNSAVGRMVLGGPWIVFSFWREEVRRVMRGDTRYVSAWLWLVVNNAVLAAWWLWVCDIAVWQMLAALYAGVMLMVLRSYLEHRPGASNDARCAIVEGEGPIALLFLNNCYHLIHHDRPGLAWYDIPKTYWQNKEYWRARTGGHWFKGYREVFWRFGLSPKDTPVHPDA